VFEIQRLTTLKMDLGEVYAIIVSQVNAWQAADARLMQSPFDAEEEEQVSVASAPEPVEEEHIRVSELAKEEPPTVVPCVNLNAASASASSAEPTGMSLTTEQLELIERNREAARLRRQAKVSQALTREKELEIFAAMQWLP
jgi:hypothetical protein